MCFETHQCVLKCASCASWDAKMCFLGMRLNFLQCRWESWQEICLYCSSILFYTYQLRHSTNLWARHPFFVVLCYTLYPYLYLPLESWRWQVYLIQENCTVLLKMECIHSRSHRYGAGDSRNDGQTGTYFWHQAILILIRTPFLWLCKIVTL